jgi:hypothetical protein
LVKVKKLKNLSFSKEQLAVFVAAFAIIGGYVLMSSHAAGSTANVFVSPNGSDSGVNCKRFASPTSNPDAGGTSLCATADKALSMANSGDTVQLIDGDYGVKLSANNHNFANQVTIKGGSGVNNNVRLRHGLEIDNSNNIMVQGVTAIPADDAGADVTLKGSSNITIDQISMNGRDSGDGCDGSARIDTDGDSVRDSCPSGVATVHGSQFYARNNDTNVALQNSNIQLCGKGASCIWGGPGLTLKGNTFAHCANCDNIRGSQGFKIIGNSFLDSDFGDCPGDNAQHTCVHLNDIQIMGGRDWDIENNFFTPQAYDETAGNPLKAGKTLWTPVFIGPVGGNADYIKIIGNLFSAKAPGIYFETGCSGICDQDTAIGPTDYYMKYCMNGSQANVCPPRHVQIINNDLMGVTSSDNDAASITFPGWTNGVIAAQMETHDPAAVPVVANNIIANPNSSSNICTAGKTTGPVMNFINNVTSGPAGCVAASGTLKLAGIPPTVKDDAVYRNVSNYAPTSSSTSLINQAAANPAGCGCVPATDYLGNARSGAPDVGAIEFSGTQSSAPIVSLTASKNNVISGQSLHGHQQPGRRLERLKKHGWRLRNLRIDYGKYNLQLKLYWPWRQRFGYRRRDSPG